MAEGTDTWTFPALRALHRLVTKRRSAFGCPGFKVLTEVKGALVVEAGRRGFASVTWPPRAFNHSDLPWVRSSAAAPGRRPTMPSSPAESKGQTAMAGIYAPRVLFLGTTYAGHATRFANLRASAMADRRLDPRFRAVTGWRDTGMLERAPLVPRWLKGRIRAVAEASPFAQFPRPDAIWLSAPEVAAPYTWAQLGPLKRPVVLDLDATPRQLEGMARLYFGRPPKQGLRRVAARVTSRLLEPSVSFYTPWSNWAAEGLRSDGVPSNKIHVIAPGVDLQQWRPNPGSSRDPASPLRLLFVGNNFVRKGGDLLVALMRSPWGQQFELDVVSGEDVRVEATNVRLRRAAPNTPELRALFARADVFVLPTRAECFGIAAVEAMASGLPVIMGNVGGAADIVDHERTGWLIEPSVDNLRAALGATLAARDELPAIGARARLAAERKFDGTANDRRVIDLLLEVSKRRAHEAGRRAAIEER